MGLFPIKIRILRGDNMNYSYVANKNGSPNPNYVPPASVKTYLDMEWINVEDRLPENGELVVTYSITKRRVSHSDCLKSYVELWGNYDEVTHWLPLPKLPISK